MNFNGAQLHLLINHAPVIGFPIALLAFVWGITRAELQVTIFSYYVTILIWATAVASYLSGDPAEGVLKALPDFPETLIHTHEDSAEIALILGSVAAIAALLQLPVFQRLIPKLKLHGVQRSLRMILLVCLVAVSLMLAVVAHQGGLIRHIEVR